MLKFLKDFNCCKTVECKNFGVSQSESYILQSERLGYLSIECKLCGSNPPWINNELVEEVLSEKLEQQFSHKVVGCHKCSPYFFIDPIPASKLHGFTSAGTQRKNCTKCGTDIERLASLVESIKILQGYQNEKKWQLVRNEKIDLEECRKLSGMKAARIIADIKDIQYDDRIVA
jgi:hypothetical protein